MEPRFVDRDAFTVMGVLARWTQETADFNAIWMDQFMAHHDLVKPLSTDGAYYGLDYQPDEQGVCEHVAGMAVPDDANAPEGLILSKVPAARYAVFGATASTIGATWGCILREWLPSSQYEHDRSLPGIEYYPPDAATGDSPVLLYVPVRERPSGRQGDLSRGLSLAAGEDGASSSPPGWAGWRASMRCRRSRRQRPHGRASLSRAQSRGELRDGIGESCGHADEGEVSVSDSSNL